MTTAGRAEPEKKIGNGLRVLVVLAVAVFFAVGVRWHLFSVNSHYYYKLPWQWIASSRVYPILLPLAIPFFLGQMIYLRRPALVWVALGLVTLSSFGLMIGGAFVQNNPPGFAHIANEIQSRWATGYFESAAMLVHKNMPVRQVLGQYPTLLEHFYLHPRQKPPGTILFEMEVIRTFGAGTTGAMASGLLIGLIASLCVVSTYKFIFYFTANRDAAFFGAGYFALCPSLLLFFPDFDPCFPHLTVGIAVLWAVALKKNQARYAVAFGLLYAVAAMISYLPGVLPVFLVGYTLLQLFGDGDRTWGQVLKHFAISVGSFVAFYLVLWALTGFDPIATFRECHRQLDVLWDKLINVYHYPRHALPWTFFTDMYDFALGSGWISFVMVGFYFGSAVKRSMTPAARIALVCVAQFVVIALIGILQTETSRIWIFMYPMLMLPIGLELARWRPGARIAVYAALLILSVAMCQSMEFMSSAQ